MPFAHTTVSDAWHDSPSLPELFPASFPGVKTSRDGFLVDTDLDRLRQRIADYFNPDLGHEEVTRIYPAVMQATARFDAHRVRDSLLRRGGPNETGFVRYAYRPFDDRWLYWEAETKLLDEKRTDYQPHVFEGNLWVEARQREAKESFSRGTLVRHLASDFGNGLSNYFPAWLRDDAFGEDVGGVRRRPNLSHEAESYLGRLGLGVEDLFYHALAVLHDPAYREANAGALRMEWPRISLPGWPDGDAVGAADELAASAARRPGAGRPPRFRYARPRRYHRRSAPGDGGHRRPYHRRGWQHDPRRFRADGRLGSLRPTGDAVMPGQGRITEREYTVDERTALGGAMASLGETTFDIHLNESAYWRNVPTAVWNYKLGGYQVLKKWLSYREHDILRRALAPHEVQRFADTARRIAAILSLVSRE